MFSIAGQKTYNTKCVFLFFIYFLLLFRHWSEILIRQYSKCKAHVGKFQYLNTLGLLFKQKKKNISGKYFIYLFLERFFFFLILPQYRQFDFQFKKKPIKNVNACGNLWQVNEHTTGHKLVFYFGLTVYEWGKSKSGEADKYFYFVPTTS